MSKVVDDLKGFEVYQYDHILLGSDKAAHDQNLAFLLRHLFEKNITVNPDKCSLCVFSFDCF